MASQDGKTFKQDMVVSIRYRNDLPPPPMPPKLLDIETGGLSQYLTPGFASALVRREEPNIEVDAEGGLPIDMIGIPGYFLGDESAILAPEVQPALDAEDAALMLNPEQLRAGGAKTVGTSFLRKTQYMTSGGTARASDPLMPTQGKIRKSVDKRPQAVSRDDKDNIKRNIQRGFDTAYPETARSSTAETRGSTSTPADREAWSKPVHPDNRSLKPVGFYPVLPDLEAVTDGGSSWNLVRFDKPPLPAYHDRRDDRIDAAVFLAQPNLHLMPDWEAAQQAYEADPNNFEDPGPAPHMMALYVPKSIGTTSKIRKILNDADPEKDDKSLIIEHGEASVDGTLRIPFARTRVYPSVKQEMLNPNRFMAISIYDPSHAPSNSRLRGQGRAAYYYPVIERMRVRTGRAKLGKNSQMTGEEEEALVEGLPDQIMVLPREMTAQELAGRFQDRNENDKVFQEKYSEYLKAEHAEREAEKADAIVEEQGELHKGAQDVTMQEIEEADQMELVPTNGGRDDDDEETDGDADMADD